MLVVVTRVPGVSVAVVHVVDVVGVRDGDVAAALAVLVIVADVLGVFPGLALVDVTVMDAMQVAFVHVVDVVGVRDGDVAAALAVLVFV
ncbi:hypothetical protein GCM10023317_26950 [Actinopolymorpha pittospori]